MRGYFWGCPSLRSGRAVSQLAGLLGPASPWAPWSAAFGGPAIHPSASRYAPLVADLILGSR
nr:hypothetical protein [Saprospira grandis]